LPEKLKRKRLIGRDLSGPVEVYGLKGNLFGIQSRCAYLTRQSAESLSRIEVDCEDGRVSGLVLGSDAWGALLGLKIRERQGRRP